MSDIDVPSVLDWAAAAQDERDRVLLRGAHEAGPDPEVLRKSIVELVDDVRDRGDAGLLDALSRFDGVTITADQLRVTAEEFAAARQSLAPDTIEAIRRAIAQVRLFNELELEQSSWETDVDGSRLGIRALPIESVGLFVPAGKGSFPSVLIQIATPAVVVGVSHVAIVIPPTPGTGGAVDPAALVAAEELGIDEVYRVNGPAGIAALAHGTETIPKVRKIVGPGSPAVTAAQLEAQRAGCLVGVGFGPTDSLIVCDADADPRLLAADLLNEAEHGPDSSAVLVSADANVLEAAAHEVARQLEDLPEPRRSYARQSIFDNGGLVKVADEAEAMEVANDYAPEHLQLAVSDPDRWLPLVRFAGTVLLGQWTTFAASNFAIGTPATLPTGGFAKATSGVTAATYLNRVAVARLNEASFRRLAPTITALAEHEGFPAHAATVTVRAGAR